MKILLYSLTMLLASWIFPYASHAQQKQTYTGSFGNGSATYGYYENDKYERVYDGPFTYTSTVENIKTSYIGAFNDGLKNGKWTYMMDCLPGAMQYVNYNKVKLAGNDKFIGSYKNGVPDGLWTYTANITTGLSSQIIETRVTYVNGKCNGEFFHSEKVKSTNGSVLTDNKITGQCVNGDMDGKWVFKSGNSEEIRICRSGFVLKSILRDATSGSINSTYDYSTEYKSEANSIPSDISVILDSLGTDGFCIVDSTLYEVVPSSRLFNKGGWYHFENTGSWPMNQELAGAFNRMDELHGTVIDKSLTTPVPMLARVYKRDNVDELNQASLLKTKANLSRLSLSFKVYGGQNHGKSVSKSEQLQTLDYFIVCNKMREGKFDEVVNYSFEDEIEKSKFLINCVANIAVASYALGLDSLDIMLVTLAKHGTLKYGPASDVVELAQYYKTNFGDVQAYRDFDFTSLASRYAEIKKTLTEEKR